MRSEVEHRESVRRIRIRGLVIDMSKKITLKDLEIRCAGILKKNPDIPHCTVKGCKNPIDHTEGMGWDTSCPYHRLLFDWWLYEVRQGDIPEDQRARRSAFSIWTKKLGKNGCDTIVLRMANDAINWSA